MPANNIMLQQRFHNFGGKLWKRCKIRLLQRNPGMLPQCCRKTLYEKNPHNIMATFIFDWKQYLILIYTQLTIPQWNNVATT